MQLKYLSHQIILILDDAQLFLFQTFILLELFVDCCLELKKLKKKLFTLFHLDHTLVIFLNVLQHDF